MAAAAGADLIITASRARDSSEQRRYGPFFGITTDGDDECTWDGIGFTRADLDHMYADCCQPKVMDDLYDAWQVTLIDPVWGRNDILWPVLEAFAKNAAAT
jgi:hypothetical protein